MVRNRHSVRLRKLDYSQPNKFFVTVCCHEHGCYFGQYKLLEKIITKNIKYLSDRFPSINVPIFTIMPNHLHLIIIINKYCPNINLGKIIQILKSKTVIDWLKIIKKNNLNFQASVFQRNYYEHRIRSDQEYFKFSLYIKNNPKNWHFDKYNPVNLLKRCRGVACQRPTVDKQKTTLRQFGLGQAKPLQKVLRHCVTSLKKLK